MIVRALHGDDHASDDQRHILSLVCHDSALVLHSIPHCKCNDDPTFQSSNLGHPFMLAMQSTPITYLVSPLRRKHEPSKASKISTHNESLPARVRTKLAQLRMKRWTEFFRNKRAKRAFSSASTHHHHSKITEKLLTIVSTFTRSNRTAWRAKYHQLASGFSLPGRNIVSNFLRAVKNTFKRIRGPSAAELLAQELMQQKAERRKYLCKQLFSAMIVEGRKVLRARRRECFKRTVPIFARAFADNLLSTYLPRVANQVCTIRRNYNAKIIQRSWGRRQRQRRYYVERKCKLLNFLEAMPSIIALQSRRQHADQVLLHQMSAQTMDTVMKSVARRMAARLIQRIWRGHQARKRVNRMLMARQRRMLARQQRERLRRAREALLDPSHEDLERGKVLKTRVQSRKEHTPLLVSAEYHLERGRMTHSRVSLLEPLPAVYTPPHVSSMTLAKTQRVPFSKFERICEQQARVNVNNLWVAVPIGFQDSQSDNHLSKKTSKPSKKTQRYFTTKYDWVPATLLRHEVDLHRAKEAASP